MLTDPLRVQPHDLEAEQAILGAILLDSAALAPAQEILTPGDFYDSRHQRIFQAMGELAKREEYVDLITLGDRLEENGHLKAIGGRSNLAELLTMVASGVNVGHHCRIVRDHASRRRLLKTALLLEKGAYEHAPLEALLHDLEMGLSSVTAGRESHSWCSASTLAEETVEHVDRASKRATDITGIPTGFHQLNELLGGWQRSDLIILAARPSMGKTALALGAALAAAENGFKIGVISLEMSRHQLGQRLHGMKGNLDIHALRTGRISPDGWWQLAHVAQQVGALPLWIDDSSLMTVEQLCSKAKLLQARHGLDLLIVDYLQLLHMPARENHQLAVAHASRRLKLLAKELDIPVIVLSQLSRECERRENKRPMLADLRDSGAIEQDADVVLFLYRHEVYDRDTDEKGVAEVLIRKHRNGPIGDRRLRFVDPFARFEALNEGL
ncbi:MAG: replicative DNA helicase [Nitrospira sp.]|nr:replicative DNA helicase [Nitrospira sp.]